MAIENVLIAKIGGGLVVAGSATSAGVYYRTEIIEKFKSVFLGEDKNYLFVVAGTTAVSADKQSNKTLYGADQPKTKNYQCQIDTTKYECDIVKEITAEKKWANTKDFFKTDSITEDGITKAKFNTADNLFLLKIISKTNPTIKWDEKQTIDIIEKVESTDKTFKQFGQLKPIFGKQNDQILGKVDLFLVKVASVVGDTSGTWTVGQDETYKCGFESSTIDKDCDIYKFADSQEPKAETDYSQLTFVGDMAEGKKIKANDSIKQHEYYLVKFKETLESKDFSKKTIIYTKTNPKTPEKTINFSPVLVSFLHTKTSKTENNLLLLNN